MAPIRIALAAVTLACWLMSLYKLRDLRRDPGNQALRYLCLTLVATTLSLTVQPWAPQFDRAVGVLNAGRVLSNCLTLVAAGAGQSFLLYTTHPAVRARPPARRRMLALLVCLSAIAVLFALTPPAYKVTDPYVRSGLYYYSTPTPAAAPYTVVFLAYLVWTLATLTRLGGHQAYARAAPRPLLRFGLRLISAGGVLGLGYVAAKLAAMAATARHTSYPALDRSIVALYAAAIAAVLIGATLPSWGTRVGLDRLWDDLAARRDCRRLRPLWRFTHDAVPDVALLPHPTRASLRRVRMTVEILDAYAQLAPWMSPVPDRTDPDADAAALAVAVRRHAAGEPFELAAPPYRAAADIEDTNAAAQVDWLVRVAAAVRRR